MSQHHLSLAPKPLDRHLLTSLHAHSCWHFGNCIIAQAAVVVFVVGDVLAELCPPLLAGEGMKGLITL